MKTLLLLVLVGMAVLAMACGGGQAPTLTPIATPTPTPTPTPCALSAPGAVRVNLEDLGGSGTYTFDPSELTFNVGDTVTFTVCAETEFHTFTVDDLGIDEAVDPGPAVSFTFTFDKPGTFPLICIPHELQGMVGTITVR